MSNRQKNADVNYQPTVAANGYTDNGHSQYSTITYTTPTSTQHKIDKANDFKQAGDFYRALPERSKAELVKNLSDDLATVTNRAIVLKMIAHFYMADADFGKKLAASLKASRQEVEAAFTNN
ncbi:catalase-related domain-containing protein [Pedobacter sp. NJ-S-72]